jgi:hypothetical protein
MLRRLRYATLSGGYLRWFMITFPSSHILAATNRKQLMGWAFTLLTPNGVHVFTYTNPRYRHRHVAARLVEQILRRHSSITVTAWDNTSWRFYRKLRRQFRGRVTVLDWYKNQWRYDRLLENQITIMTRQRGVKRTCLKLLSFFAR